MRILITFALENEFAPWRQIRAFHRTAEGGTAAYESEVNEARVRVAFTGIGSANAKSVMANAVRWEPDVCISSGFAGSLRPAYCIGDVFAAREVMELESGRTIAADHHLLTTAEKRGARVAERLLSSSEMVVTAEGKSRLGRMAEAVEMESFAVLTEAAARKIPGVVIRAISDAANEELPMDFSTVLNHSGKIDNAKLALAVARAPHKLPALLRLGRNSRRAATKLAELLEIYVQDIATGAIRRAEVAEATRA